MFGSLVNSRNKENLSFAAMGNFQAEFFDIEGERYFAIYQHLYEGSREVVIKLSDAKITVDESKTEYLIKVGRNRHRYSFLNRKQKTVARFTQYIFGWLPFMTLKGQVSAAGKALIDSELSKYLKDNRGNHITN